MTGPGYMGGFRPHITANRRSVSWQLRRGIVFLVRHIPCGGMREKKAHCLFITIESEDIGQSSSWLMAAGQIMKSDRMTHHCLHTGGTLKVSNPV